LFKDLRARDCSARLRPSRDNVRLGAYNGLHLVYLCSSGQGAPRCIVYSDERDSGLAEKYNGRGVLRSGQPVAVTLAAYVREPYPIAIGEILSSPIDGAVSRWPSLLDSITRKLEKTIAHVQLSSM